MWGFSPEDRIDALQKLCLDLEIELEENDTRYHEASFIFFKQVKRGYDIAVAHCSAYYDLEIKVDSSTLTLTIEEGVLVSEKLPSWREDFVKKKYDEEVKEGKRDSHYDITNKSLEGQPLLVNPPGLCVGTLQDPFVDHLQAYNGRNLIVFFKVERVLPFLSKRPSKGYKPWQSMTQALESRIVDEVLD